MASGSSSQSDTRAAAAARKAGGLHAVSDRVAKLVCTQAAITVLAAVLIFGVWLGVIIHVQNDRDEVAGKVVRQNNNLAIAFEAHVNHVLKSADQLVLSLRREFVAAGRLANSEGSVAGDVIDTAVYRDFAVIDALGRRLLSRGAAHADNVADSEYFRFHAAGDRDELYIGKAVSDEKTGLRSIALSRRINKADGSFGGVLVLLFDPDYLLNFYRSVDIGRDGLIEVVGLDGISRARHTGSTPASGTDLSASSFVRAGVVGANGALETEAGAGGAARFVSYRTLRDYPMMVAVGVSRDEVLAPLVRDARGYYLIAVIANLVAVFFAKVMIGALGKDKESVEALARSEARYRAAFDHAAVGVSQTGLDGRFLQVNQTLCKMLGYSEEEMLARSLHDVTHPGHIDGSEDRRKKLLAGEDVPAGAEKIYLHKDGSEIWMAVSTALVRDVDGAPEYFVNMIESIIERKKLQENLEHLARHDSLTQLPNRALFYNRLQQALKQARRHDWTTAVMFVDLDRFKTINDTLGHAVGDEVLQQVAVRLMRCVRAEDTVGRLGGDEFAVILSEIAHEEDAGVVAQKILDALGRPFQLQHHEVFITTSIGIETCKPGESDADTVLSNADAAMYDAKRVGRNNYQFYAATMSERAMERLLLEKELRYAIPRNEFELNFQPKVSLQSGEISGFEALLRWHRTGGEMVSPAIFIPVIEECGLIHEVGEWVLRSACAQISAWQQAGQKPVPIAVNLSAKQFQCVNICDVVLRAMNDHGVDPSLIELEITESAAMNNADEAIAALKNLKALGVRIAIDDFGTGYSSLSYLTRFPIDYLKIDRSFVIDLPDSRDGASIARAVINMAHALRLKVIAEGVEVAEQLQFMVDNGCDEIQGYYFSRPLPAEQATEMLRSKRRLTARPQLVSAAA